MSFKMIRIGMRGETAYFSDRFLLLFFVVVNFLAKKSLKEKIKE